MNKIHPQISNFYLMRYAFFAFPLSFLGISLYIYLPKFYNDNYGVSLSSLGLILLLSRITDAITDPIIGSVSDKFYLTQKKYFILISIFLVLFFNLFFYPSLLNIENIKPYWFCFVTIFVYLSFSFIYINYYNLGLKIAFDDAAKVKLSSYRELSSFMGMIISCVLPAILIKTIGNEVQAFRVFALIFGLLIILAIIILPESEILKNKVKENILSNLKYIFSNQILRLIIMLFFVNSLAVSITSNLFSFFVDQWLRAKDSMPIFLIVYLISGAIAALFFSFFLKTLNKAKVLLLVMIISAFGFSLTYFLDSTNYYLFYFVCVISGVGLGGELIIFPIIASINIDKDSHYGNSFFAIYSSCSKISLAIAAGLFLPLISLKSTLFTDIAAPNKIRFCYTVVPLTIKLFSIIMLYLVQNNLSRKQK